MRFHLGIIDPALLDDPRYEGVDCFVSRNRLMAHRGEVRARTFWILDSSAFTEIERHGRWTVPPEEYAGMAARWQREIGRMTAAAICDYMCEPEMLEKTGMSVHEHQMLTTRSFLELRDLEPGVPWMPVLQGYEPEEYLRHMDQYEHVGVDLLREPLVGIGSVCRRQQTDEAEALAKVLYRIGLRTHFFGFATPGLRRVARYLHSSDSMSWSLAAKLRPVRMPECRHSFPTCEYCPDWALKWRRDLMRTLGHVV